MSELAGINAKIYRLNRKLKADPIVVVSQWPKTISLGERDGVTFCEGTVTILVDSADQVFETCLRAARTLACVENRFAYDIILARKIQLAILERLTS